MAALLHKEHLDELKVGSGIVFNPVPADYQVALVIGAGEELATHGAAEVVGVDQRDEVRGHVKAVGQGAGDGVLFIPLQPYKERSYRI